MPAGAPRRGRAIQSLVKEENIDCGFARTGNLNLAPKARPLRREGMDEAIVATMGARRGGDSVTGLPEGSTWL